MPSLVSLGEFGLIERIESLVGRPGQDVIAGIGDDCAVLEGPPGQYLLATTDIQVEGSHFRRRILSWRQLGWRAGAITISDIAAMGGEPRHLLVSLALPTDTSVELVEQLYRGLGDLSRRFGLSIVGGNVARAPESLLVDVFALGYVPRDEVLYRSGARVGDALLVTGHLGAAAAGLELVRRGEDETLPIPKQHASRLKERLLTPVPRVEAGRAIAHLKRATAMLDLSDGLSSDVQHLTARSGVGAVVWAEALPLAPAVTELARATGRDPLAWALDGGEDYELLFTAPPEAVEELSQAVHERAKLEVTAVGEIRPQGDGVKLERAGEPARVLDAQGWDHFGAM